MIGTFIASTSVVKVMTNTILVGSLTLGVFLMFFSFALLLRRRKSFNHSQVKFQTYLAELDKRRSEFDELLKEAEEYSNDLRKKFNEFGNLEKSVINLKEELLEVQGIMMKSLETLRPVVTTFIKSVKTLETELKRMNREVTSAHSTITQKGISKPAEEVRISNVNQTKTDLRSQSFDILLDKISTGKDELRKDPRLGVLGLR